MADKNTYASKATGQIPRLLSCLDRNSFSPSYGCFDREYWLTRTCDFPDAIAQFGILSLALVWAFRIPDGEQYYKNPEIKQWVIAGMRYWMKIQHGDGSFDEFYPNERGWAGPTGFLVYAMLRSYEVLGLEFPKELETDFFEAVKKSAWFLATREESGILANHHAMALLAVYQSCYHLKPRDALFAQKLLSHFKKRLRSFLSYCYPEGWALEYDGADPGYLSATVSFLSKMQRYEDGSESWSQKIQAVIDRAVEFCSYFLYPNGSYGGTVGSRQTLHFYAHGFELQAQRNPLSASCARAALDALASGRLVAPEIQDDRYYLYRIPEFLEAFIDASDAQSSELLPRERTSFTRYFKDAKIIVHNTESHYTVLNLAKGGVLKIFDKHSKKLIAADDGLVATLDDKKYLTTQWIGPEYTIEHVGQEWIVRGNFHAIPYQYFNPVTMIGFRLFMLATGWNARIAEYIKGTIRNLLMTKALLSGLHFERRFLFNDHQTVVTNFIRSDKPIASLRIAGQFAARYVPQSRYFQIEELDNLPWTVANPNLNEPIIFTVNLSDNTVFYSAAD